MKILFRGKVIAGLKRGQRLNFPTANVKLHTHISEGIYISSAKLQEKTYKSLTFIGPAIHFNEKDYKAEVYLFDFDENIYGKWISVTLLQKIRENQKFTSVTALIKEMKNDKRVAKEYFAKH